MNEQPQKKIAHDQTEAGRLRWRCDGDSSLRSELPCVHVLVWQGGEAAVGHRHAVQHIQQWNAARVVALHEREAWLDVFRRAEQGKEGVGGTRSPCRNGSGAVAKQGELVWPHLVGAGQHKRAGDCHPVLAERCICSVETKGQFENKTNATSAKNYILLSVVRTRRPLYKSDVRTRRSAHISVVRTYARRFYAPAISGRRTPSRYATLCNGDWGVLHSSLVMTVLAEE